MMKSFFLLYLSFFSLLSAEPFCYFVPPKGWKMIEPSQLSSTTLIAFVAPSHEPFRASINLGSEKTNVSLQDYIEAVKKRFSSKREHEWKSLGYIKTQAGNAHLSSVETKHGFGQTTSLQAILSIDNTIYVMTALSLKEDFSSYYPVFLKTFESFSHCSDLLDSVLPSQRELLSQKIESVAEAVKKLSEQKKKTSSIPKTFQKKQFQSFEKYLEKSFKEKGLAWKFLVCQEIYSKKEASK